MKLVPQQLYWHARSKGFDKLASYHIDDCIECGCCQVVCPAKLPLVHYFRFAKSELKAQERERKKADVSRLRSETRLLRLEKIKQEQEERKAQRKANRKRAAPRRDGAPPRSAAVPEISPTTDEIPEKQPDETASAENSDAQARTMVR
jgi:electron transport complex protein RnfC